MQAAKEKVSDMASEAKAKAKIAEAKATEMAQKAGSTSHLSKEIAHQKAKVKEAEAKMVLHQNKLEHRIKRVEHEHDMEHLHHRPGVHPTTGGGVTTTYPKSGGVLDPNTGKYVYPASDHTTHYN